MPGPQSKDRRRGPGPDYVPASLATRIAVFNANQAAKTLPGFRKPGSQNRKK